MSKKTNFTIYLLTIMMVLLITINLVTLVASVEICNFLKIIELILLSFSVLPFFSLINEYRKKIKVVITTSRYSNKLNEIVIKQSHNPLFYQGNVVEAAKILTKQITETIDTDRCSLWLYNEDKSSIICKQLYVKAEDKWYDDIELFRKDFEPYFSHLEFDPIIIANNAEKHEATSCFTESYLKPLKIKSMLDVPILYRGEVIGVFCIEGHKVREWISLEVNFARLISSIYSFAYSIKEVNKLQEDMKQFENFVNNSVLVSKADKYGKITYVNKKFEEVSGYSLEDVLGKDHNIVNSGHHNKEFWGGMYDKVVARREIWNDIVTNRNKDGELYWVDSYIKSDFDENGKLTGFHSIRYDVSELKRKEIDIKNRMNAINTSNMVIEFDLDGNIIFANKSFCNKMGYKEKEIKGKHHSLFVTEEIAKSSEYKKFWNSLKNGKYISDEFPRITRDKKQVWLQATYNPIFGVDGKLQRIMKIATDITERITQSIEIEKKNTYLEHAAKILRHDMHSGINTYIPRGVSSLERRLTPEQMEELKITAPFKMIKDGLIHTQKVYKGVYEFTNLVKKDSILNVSNCDLKQILESYLNTTSYKSQVIIHPLIQIDVNEPLFCTAIDNLIRNGLKYNDSNTKVVTIQMEDDNLTIQDNGRGLTQEEFLHLSKPYTRKEGQKESGTGLGLNICVAILEEHGFSILAEKNEIGTKMKIKLK